MIKPMLAQKGDPSDLKYPVAAQHKLDGIRAMVVDGKLVSRTLKPIPNAEIRAALERPEFEGLDGELIVGSPMAKGCMQRTTSFVMAPSKTGEDWTYWVFDKWDEEGFFEERWGQAYDIITRQSDSHVIPLWYVQADTIEQLGVFEANTVAQGHEGVIARTLDSPYKFGRSGKRGPLIKVKRFIDFEALVLGVYEEMHNANEAGTNALGRTERSTKKAGMVGKGTLGGLILRAVNGPHKGQEFRCGTGFNADQRGAFWYTHTRYEEVGPEKAKLLGVVPLIGRFAKIKSFPIGTKDAPRFPVFLGWRSKEDFDEGSISD